MSGRSTSPSSRQTNPRRAGATAKRSARLGGSASPLREHRRLDAAQERRLPLRLAAVRERDDDAVPRADEPGELVLRLGEAARGDRRPLRLERERLRPRERVELAPRRSRSIGARPSSSPDPTHVVRLPDEVGRAVERRDEVVRHVDDAPGRRRRRASARRGRRDARRPGRRPRRSTGCSARCVNGENARTCSISSPKSSTRSGSRPVDGKTSTRPPRTANWPRSSTRSTRSYPASASCSASPSIPGSSPTASASGAAAPRRGGSPSASAGADAQTSPPRGEHVERAAALADEVRRRREPGLPARRPGSGSSATRAVARGTSRRLGGVARVGVLGEQHEERAAELARGARRGRAAAPAPRRGRASAARRTNAWKRSVRAKLVTKAASGATVDVRVASWSMRLAGIAPRGAIVLRRLTSRRPGAPRALIHAIERTRARSAPASCRMCAVRAGPGQRSVEAALRLLEALGDDASRRRRRRARRSPRRRPPARSREST